MDQGLPTLDARKHGKRAAIQLDDARQWHATTREVRRIERA